MNYQDLTYNPNTGFAYFAYGSNMNLHRLVQRVGAVVTLGTARLEGWRVVERLYADIEPFSGVCVHGVLYFLSYDQFDKLCEYEGAPEVYDCRTMMVSCDGVTGPAMVFVMSSETAGKREGQKFPGWYLNVCQAGALAHEFPFVYKAAPEAPLVAVYGTLLKGERNARVAAGAGRRRACRLCGELWDTGWGYPHFVSGWDFNSTRDEIMDANCYTVEAEVFSASADVMARLDALEGYPNLYTKELVPVLLSDGSIEYALVYVMNDPPSGSKRIDCDSWREYRRSAH